MTKIDVSFDSETFGTEPGCDIRSIGACVFVPSTGFVHDGSLGTIKTFYQAVDNPSDWTNNTTGEVTCVNGLTRDARTVQWWSEQTAEAQAVFANPVDLRAGLVEFGCWLRDVAGGPAYSVSDHDRRYPDDVNLWSHGAAFDAPIIAAAYRACGLPVPWHYRAPRDTRTCFDMAGVDDHSAWLNLTPGPLGIAHHALDDAICQARAICAAFERVRISHDVRTHYRPWREALVAHRHTQTECDNREYWDHEVIAFDRTFSNLMEHPLIEPE